MERGIFAVFTLYLILVQVNKETGFKIYDFKLSKC